MNELIGKLGVDWKLLIAQIINFLVLLVILYKLLYRPLLDLLQRRTKTIETSLEQAKEIEKRMKETEQEREEILNQTRQESQQILIQAQERAKILEQEMKQSAQEEFVQAAAKAQEELARQKEAALEEIKKEAGGLVVAAVRKIVGQNLDAKIDQKLIANILETKDSK